MPGPIIAAIDQFGGRGGGRGRRAIRSEVKTTSVSSRTPRASS